MTVGSYVLNVSTVINRLAEPDRFDVAARLGFDTVEFWWPRNTHPDTLADAVRSAGVSVANHSIDCGDPERDEAGLLVHETHAARFRDAVLAGIELACATGCPQIYTLCGRRDPSVRRSEQLKLARSTLRWAAREAGKRQLRILVEASSEGRLRLPATADEAAALVEAAAAPNAGLLLDVYHQQRTGGNLLQTLQRHRRLVKHVQLADVPGRGEPGTGSIPFKSLLPTLVGAGYRGCFALEYYPTRTLCDSVQFALEHLPLGPREAVSG